MLGIRRGVTARWGESCGDKFAFGRVFAGRLLHIVVPWMSMGCLPVQPYGAGSGTPTGAASVQQGAVLGPGATGDESANEREPWISDEPETWPQVVLTNYATFDGHTPLYGASAFLVRARNGQIFAATARHLIQSAGGVEPPMSASELAADWHSWRVFPRTETEKAIQLAAPKMRGLDEPGRDWLLLPLASAGERPPAHALRLRREPARAGENVYLVGCPYKEPRCRQRVYPGTVARRIGDYFAIALNIPVQLAGFSGAPVLDERGNVVAVMTMAFPRTIVGGVDTEAGGEDVGPTFELLERAAASR